MAEVSSKEYGKKVFFLNPPSVIKDEMVKKLIENEYEVYLLQDHRKALAICKIFPDSIVFINIDQNLKDSRWENWEEYIKNVMRDDKTKDVRIGILSYESDKELIEKYLMEIMVPCGFVRLSLGLKESTSIIMKALDANEAKSRRKYVRIRCVHPIRAVISFQKDNQTYSGKITDISSFGMSFVLDGGSASLLQNKEYIRDIQIRLQGKLSKVDGHVIGRREERQTVFVVIFGKDTRENGVERIHEFIYDCLQNEMDKRLKGI